MKNEKLVNDKIKCSGCGLCAIKCPKNAIKMKEDDAGFIYPYIDKNKCVDCGLCKKICTYSKNPEKETDKKCFAIVSNNDNILKSTASGGVFTTIAEHFIKNNGVVYGASLEKSNNIFSVKHIRITKSEDLDLVKGSKYSQSSIVEIYEELKNDINNNKKVLFSGTPCQVAAIKKHIGDNDNLYTIDIICHGVPNNKMFNDYITSLSKNNKEILDFRFRDKSKGWGLFYSYSLYDRKRKKEYSRTAAAYNSSYYQLFLDSYIYRINCYSCPFSNTNRVGDLTIGDYWGIEKEHPELVKDATIDIKKGVSCLIVNSKKGKTIINSTKNSFYLFETTLDSIKKHNSQLNRPCALKPERESIIDDYVKNGYSAIDNFYKKKYGKIRLIKNIWFLIPKKIRRIIKK